jgi:nucleoside-diphosphate kinase
MPDPIERTLVLIKPDAVRRGLIGDILARIERRGLVLVAVQLRVLDRPTAEEHYGEHRGKSFFEPVIDFITGGPLLAAVAEGPRAVETWRTTMGITDPVKAAPGTIRGDFGLTVGENLVHGSDSVVSAIREVELFFPDLT